MSTRECGFGLFLAIAAIGCAARQPTFGPGSASRASASADGAPLYQDYQVAVRAKAIGRSRISPFTHLPPAGERFFVDVRYVVDTLGRTEPCAFENLGENPPGAGKRSIQGLSETRFTPAIRQGQKVRMSAVLHAAITRTGAVADTSSERR